MISEFIRLMVKSWSRINIIVSIKIYVGVKVGLLLGRRFLSMLEVDLLLNV